MPTRCPELGLGLTDVRSAWYVFENVFHIVKTPASSALTEQFLSKWHPVSSGTKTAVIGKALEEPELSRAELADVANFPEDVAHLFDTPRGAGRPGFGCANGESGTARPITDMAALD